MNIHVGDEIELTEEVVPENTAEKWGSGSLPVYATPAMISLICLLYTSPSPRDCS